jgi:8-oxo-dGTP diphosphatase
VGKYDVVGGRIEPGQNFLESLLREIDEETKLKVKVGKAFHVGEWRPIVKGKKWQVVGIFFECTTENEIVKLSEDHSEYKWINPIEFSQYPLIDKLQLVFLEYLKINPKM